MKIAVAGAGHLGKIHISCIKQIDELELVGFFDPNQEVQTQVSTKFDVAPIQSFEELISMADIIDIVTPTPTHYELAKEAVSAGKHVFIEKPVTQSVEEAYRLQAIAEQNHALIQVGHVERFNPAFMALAGRSLQPVFIEGHRLAQFNPRGTDVSVVLDLMIHDIDLVLAMVQSPVEQILANGVAVVSDTPDICNARITFTSGCVANLTASRISLKTMRKLRFFQPNEYVSIDLLEKEAQMVKLYDAEDVPTEGQIFPLETTQGTKYIQVDIPEIKPQNAIMEELRSFYHSILNNQPVKVPIKDAIGALEIAEEILIAIQKNQQSYYSKHGI